MEELILKELPIFSGLSNRQLKIIKSRADIAEYRKGDIIYEEGSPASALYCLITGRVVVYTGRLADKTILEYLHRGKYFGMISLLTNEPHSVTAQALNDCQLLTIKKEDFDYILKKIPSLAIDLSKTLSRRLKRKDIHQKKIFESTIISVFSSQSQVGKSIYALNLALSLRNETRKSVIILNIVPEGSSHTFTEKLKVWHYKTFNLSGSAPIFLGSINEFISKSEFNVDLICLYCALGRESCLKNMLDILSVLVNDYHYIIMDLPSIMDKFIFGILNQSDIINLLTSDDPLDLKDTYNLIEKLKREYVYQVEKIKVIINEYKPVEVSQRKEAEILKQEIFATLPKIESESIDRLVIDKPDCEYSKAIRRIARHVGDCLVGLVLGVGVGYGFCHIGVLKVVEEEKIPIDVIVGSSVGSLIASLWAIGKTSEEILKITEEFKEPNSIWGLIDFTLPFLGFIKGAKFYKFLKKYFGEMTFDEVKVPLKLIASEVKKKEARVLDKGYLADAIMASCRMPGVFTPFKFKEEILFDGGVTHPLPTEPLLKMGVKKIIAINVTPSREDVLRQYERIRDGLAAAPAGEKTSFFNFKQRIKSKFNTNILDYIFSSIEILQSEVAKKEAQLADVVLHPDTQGLYWLELHRAKEFAKRGEEEARRHLDEIRQLISE
ncbi:MAG: patatin-like phospholipase family protein [Candidatus Omnitrophica bacterium]|nr:patatin-like phospholipase family protein [Candidatus Omnitrophota bacterium]